jgi:phosphate-selective porin OprO/OprP
MMKKGVAAVALLTAALMGQSAMAKTLEDVLKEKGVITEEDYKAVSKNRAVDYKLGEGFTFTSPDEKFKGSIGVSEQIRYTFLNYDHDYAGNNGKSNQSEFKLRRIKLYFNGYAYSPDLTYKVQVNFAELGNNPSSPSKFMEETFVNYRLMDEVQFRFGQDKVPFARQELTSTTAQQFVDRSFVTDAFKPGYDTGLKINGKVAKGLLTYDMGVFGGAGQSVFRTTNDNAFAARVVVNPFGEMKLSEADLDNTEKPLLSVGANYYRNTMNGDTTGITEKNNVNLAGGWVSNGIKSKGVVANDKIDIDTVGVDAAFKWLGASFQGEYFTGFAKGQNGPAEKQLRAHGFYAQAGYFVLPKHLELAMRYAWMDPDRDKANNLKSEVQGAISYYFNKHNLKLQADVTDTHDQAKASSDDMTYRVQAQILF